MLSLSFVTTEDFEIKMRTCALRLCLKPLSDFSHIDTVPVVIVGRGSALHKGIYYLVFAN